MSSREYPDKPVCGVGVVCLKDDQVLLVKRAKPPITWQWSIPGGGQELGETTREAALRELKEETGVDAELIGLIDVIDTVREDEEGRIQFHYTLVDFAAIWTSGEALADDDVSDAQWVHLSDLENKGLWSETIRVIREAVIMRDERRG
ncbi:MAG TPA: phosphohydrolase [Rhodospirillaceae bacterium]|nr:phosphohydrolase [Rhodospirillaceae bacterium]|tara:strand:+ start:667 stop:1110 length:444 start_codon:yes stop_codon:yes gene_type:complete